MSKITVQDGESGFILDGRMLPVKKAYARA
jgi:hypothetical protein